MEKKVVGVMAEFKNPADLIHGAEKMRDAGYKHFDCHSPFPIHGMDEAMGEKRSPLGYIVGVVGFFAIVGMIAFQGWTSAIDYPIIVSGKRFFSYQAFVIPTWAVMVLSSAIVTVLGMIALNRLPRFHHPVFYSDNFEKFSTDGFFISVKSNTRLFLKDLFKVLSVFLFSIFFTSCYQGRPSEKPAIHINPSMDDQPRYDPQEKSMFFADGATMRPPVEGTVARGFLKKDIAFYKGKNANDDFIDKIPMKVTMDVLSRGQQRYNIYCAPCHSTVGDGKGIVPKRGFLPPPSFHQDYMRDYKDGYIFDVISNGIRNMPGYDKQIPVEDRWAIVAHFRVLQRSQYASQQDVPSDILNDLK